MPKAKAKPPKVIIKELETALQELQTAKAVREKELLDMNTRLTDTIDNLKSIILTQTKERDAVHETIEKELRYDLSTANHEIQKFKEELALSKANAAELRTLKGERMNLLRQLSEAIASREEAEKNHALETHDLTSRITGLKARLETVFNDTLRTAVAEEKKRLALTLDAEAAAALREVGQLRVQVGQQGRQIIQLMRIAEEKERETNLARKEQERATEEAEEISAKYSQQTTMYTTKFALSEQLVVDAQNEMRKAIVYAQALHERNQSLLRDNAAFRVQLNLPPYPIDDESSNFSSSAFHQSMKQTIHRSEQGLRELRRIRASPSPSPSSPSLSPSVGELSTGGLVPRPGSALLNRNGTPLIPHDPVKETGLFSSFQKQNLNISMNAPLSSSSSSSTTLPSTTVRPTRPSTAKPTIGMDEIYHEMDMNNQQRNKNTNTGSSSSKGGIIRPSSAAVLSSPSASPSSSSLHHRTIPISPIHTRLYTRPSSAQPSSLFGTKGINSNAPPPSSIQSVYYNTGNPETSFVPPSPSTTHYKQYSNINGSSNPSSSLVTSPMATTTASSTAGLSTTDIKNNNNNPLGGFSTNTRPSSARPTSARH